MKGVGIEGLGCRDEKFRVWGLRLRVSGLEIRIEDFGVYTAESL